jgi:predicted  nucleic acid-binding Zn-ribbon protein
MANLEELKAQIAALKKTESELNQKINIKFCKLSKTESKIKDMQESWPDEEDEDEILQLKDDLVTYEDDLHELEDELIEVENELEPLLAQLKLLQNDGSLDPAQLKLHSF